MKMKAKNKMRWIRIGDYNECSICGHKGYCMVSSNGSYCCCARVESPIRLGDAGWVHLNKTGQKIIKPIRHYPSDFMRVWKEADYEPNTELLEKLWSVNSETLNLFLIRYSEQKGCYLFPMRSGKTNEIVGIQERYLNGDKKATSGSKLGLFIPDIQPDIQPDIRWSLNCPEPVLVICEGLSDTATMFDLGFLAIGRPTCSTGTEYILDFLSHNKFGKIYIAADNDTVGVNGAVKLRNAIRKYYATNVTIVIPPPGVKDVRDWRRKNPRFVENFLESKNFML